MKADITFFFYREPKTSKQKVLLENLRHSVYNAANYVSTRVDHHMKVCIPSVRTNKYSDSFNPKTSEDWKHLITPIVSIMDQNDFKSAITTHFCNVLFLRKYVFYPLRKF